MDPPKETVASRKKLAYGVQLLRRLPRPRAISKYSAYRLYIFILTYLLYITFHIVRRPLAVTKSVLHENCTRLVRPPDFVLLPGQNESDWCSWVPFDRGYSLKFAFLDFSYRFSYALGMVFSGHLGERMDVRLFLSIVMVISGLWVIFGGLAFFWGVHSYSYFVVAQVCAGVSQSAGWPSVVTLMGNWFGKKRRGLIFGIWNTDTSVGNILGSVIAGIWVSTAWGFSFVVPGLIIAIGGIFAFFLVVVQPEDVGLPPPNYSDDVVEIPVKVDPEASTARLRNSFQHTEISGSLGADLETDSKSVEEPEIAERPSKPVTIWGAILIPGVIEYSICLFFCKAVYYAFFFWLPVYIKESINVENQMAADISTVFDGGGIIGGILAGFTSDLIGGSATVCGIMFVLAIPAIFCLEQFVKYGVGVLIALLLIIGLLLNGPYTLITTAVSADLGTRPSLVKEKKSLTTVTAVIDAMGSLGSAVGPLIAGVLAAYGWKAVFYYLIAAQVCAVVCLTRLIYREALQWIAKGKAKRDAKLRLQFKPKDVRRDSVKLSQKEHEF